MQVEQMGNSLKLLTCSLHVWLFLICFHPNRSFVISYNHTSHSCPPHQSLALLQFKRSLSSINAPLFSDPLFDDCYKFLGSGYHPKMMNWSSTRDCCNWDGITCNPLTGDVIGVDLSCGMLQGTIHPNTTLFHLPHLRRLNLAFNLFYPSSLPHDIGRLANTLTHLNLSYSYLSGAVPSEISLLSKLVSLDLSRNPFDSRLEPHVFNSLLHNSSILRELSLAFVNISSGLPNFLNMSCSSSLRFLDLSDTGLYGKLPQDIFSLPYLETLHLGFNNALIGSLTKVNISTNIPLKSLEMSEIVLPRDIISDSIVHLKSLIDLWLNSCNLVGPLPKSLGNLVHLTTLHLSDNMLNGTLPSWLFTLPSIECIYLGDNAFSGGIPSELFSRKQLKELVLANNQLGSRIDALGQGPVRQSFLTLVNLHRLDVSFNNLTGVWDLDTLLSLKNLQYLCLSYSGLFVVTNNANRHVNPSFVELALASCKLKVFPESLRAMKHLRHLDLSNNQIHGQIPDWAGEIGGNQLESLNLSHNHITRLPRFQWEGLTDLDLGSNELQGKFPSSICNMNGLSLLDISNNCFYGLIPECFGNLTYSLRMANMGHNCFHGIIPKMNNDCESLGGLILNGNRFEGEVPISLSNCQSLEVLDLGNNHFNGTFPSWLGDLPWLQVLVLKSNNFYGPIRTSSVTEHPFPSLQILDLSQNSFVGDLPKKYFVNFKAMRNIVKRGTKPEYMQFGGEYYSLTIVVKDVSLSFTKVFVDYTIVDLSSNRFEGEIPDVIGSLDSLISLNVSHNSLTGRIPHTLGNLLEIESLDLSSNQLRGEIPHQLASLNSLAVLNLSINHLVGRIPQGPHFDTFEANSFVGNELCGRPLPIECKPPQSPEPEADDDDDDDGFITWKVVTLGYGCGLPIGIAIGYVMFRTGRPKWFIEISDELEHRIERGRNKTKRVYIGK